MTATTDTQRSEVLRRVWQTGPHSFRALVAWGWMHGLSMPTMSRLLTELSREGLIFADASPADSLRPMFGPALDAENAARREYARLTGVQSCRICGCSDSWACDGGCSWAESDLCSACQDADWDGP